MNNKINTSKTSETYQAITQIKDWGEYFNDIKARLKGEMESLENRVWNKE